MKNILHIIIALGFITSSTMANNSWSTYHWARTTSTFDLLVINSTTDNWDLYIGNAISGWSQSDTLDLVVSNGSTSKKTRRQCHGGSGKVRICNLAYGRNGWLGIAGISIDSKDHIVTGYTKLNDSYFSDPFYDQTWMQSVACQELGHNIGLDHQDENFNNLPLLTCMDYQNPPYPVPNFHDYDQLSLIYGHLDSYSSYYDATSNTESSECKAPKGKGCNKSEVGNNEGWGKSLGRRGQSEQFIRIDRFGIRHLTHVIWAIGN